jgi:VanZ family protein
VVFLDNSGTVLDIYAAENPLQFRLMQWRDELLIRRNYFDDSHHLKTAELELANAFLSDEPVTFTIIAGPNATVAYRNGQKAGTSSRLELSCADFAGQLLLGEAPTQDNPWRGKVFELELFRGNGTDGQSPSGLATPAVDSTLLLAQRAVIADRDPFAGYTFREGSGQTAHNSVAAGPDLHIPEIFVVLHKQLLLAPWKELEDKLTVRDIAINIVGFMPFGFLVFAYFYLQRRWPHAAVLTVFAGFAISATIEVLQAYIPSRTSGVLDIITNTLGTGLGVWLFHWRPLQVFASKLRFYELPEKAAQE